MGESVSQCCRGRKGDGGSPEPRRPYCSPTFRGMAGRCGPTSRVGTDTASRECPRINVDLRQVSRPAVRHDDAALSRLAVEISCLGPSPRSPARHPPAVQRLGLVHLPREAVQKGTCPPGLTPSGPSAARELPSCGNGRRVEVASPRRSTPPGCRSGRGRAPGSSSKTPSSPPTSTAVSAALRARQSPPGPPPCDWSPDGPEGFAGRQPSPPPPARVCVDMRADGRREPRATSFSRPAHARACFAPARAPGRPVSGARVPTQWRESSSELSGAGARARLSRSVPGTLRTAALFTCAAHAVHSLASASTGILPQRCWLRLPESALQAQPLAAAVAMVSAVADVHRRHSHFAEGEVEPARAHAEPFRPLSPKHAEHRVEHEARGAPKDEHVA